MCTCPCRLLLFLVNIVVGLTAFILSVLGAILIWGKPVFAEQLSGVLVPMIGRFYDIPFNSGSNELVELILGLSNIFGPLIFSLGTIVFVICLIGCLGACCDNQVYLKTYIGILAVVTFVEAVCLVTFYINRDTMFKAAKEVLSQSVRQYQSIAALDQDSKFLSFIMPVLDCCGVTNGLDFKNSTRFARERLENDTIITIEYPVPCCKMDDKFRIIDSTCPRQFTLVNSNFRNGCWPVVRTLLSRFTNVAALIGFTTIVLQLVLLLLSTLPLTWTRFAS